MTMANDEDVDGEFLFYSLFVSFCILFFHIFNTPSSKVTGKMLKK